MLLVPPGKKINLKKDYDPGATGELVKKKEAQKLLADGIQQLAEYQDKLYAQNTYALLIIFQAMDAAGKDGVIKHVMSGVNPQGVQVTTASKPPRRKNWIMIICGAISKLCPSAATSASSIARTTKKCWSCACIPKFWNASNCRRI